MLENCVDHPHHKDKNHFFEDLPTFNTIVPEVATAGFHLIKN